MYQGEQDFSNGSVSVGCSEILWVKMMKSSLHPVPLIVFLPDEDDAMI